MIYGSVCSGIEAASVAWHPLGWRAAFLSEIEAFPRAVLAHHYPTTPLHGDFTTIREGEYAPIELLVGGTPCQSFSIAGLRGGMADERGNLALEYLRLADRLRPAWLVWGNVPGVLSSNGGRDFGAFLGGLGQLGYGFAYRVLDAQHFGLAQRRQRVFVVGYFGDWRRAAAVLFEPASLRGHPAPRREAGKNVAAPLTAGSPSGSGYRNDPDTSENLVARPLTANQASGSGGHWYDAETETLLPIAYRTNAAGQVDAQGDLAAALTTMSDPCAQFLAFDATQCTSPANRSNPKAGDPCYPLAASAHPPSIAYAIQERAVCENPNAGPDGAGFRADVSYTLEARTVPQSVAHAAAVRRLTPRECARLQGFPDDYLDIQYRGKPAADGPRYRALGNSMAVPCMSWIGQRINAEQARINASHEQAA